MISRGFKIKHSPTIRYLLLKCFSIRQLGVLRNCSVFVCRIFFLSVRLLCSSILYCMIVFIFCMIVFLCEVALFFYTVRLFFAFFAIEMFCFSVRNFLVCNCLIFCQIALYSTYKIVQFFCLIVCFRGLNFSYLSVHKCFLTSTGHTYILLLDVHLFSLGLFCFHLRFFCFFV